MNHTDLALWFSVVANIISNTFKTNFINDICDILSINSIHERTLAMYEL
jgi:hypothetical protein